MTSIGRLLAEPRFRKKTVDNFRKKVQNTDEPPVPVKHKKRRLEDIRVLIPEFKEFYYSQMLTNGAANPNSIITNFNSLHPDYDFYPDGLQYKKWQGLWMDDINSKRAGMSLKPIINSQLIKVRGADESLLPAPDNTDIEVGTRTLAGELMNDALNILKDDQKRGEELYSDEVLIKRRKHVLAVYNFVSRNATATEAVNLKKQANARENTNFLMDLLRRSTAGKISDDEMSLLRSSVKIEINDEQTGDDNQQLLNVNAA